MTIQWLAFAYNRESILRFENIFNKAETSLQLYLEKDELLQEVHKNDHCILLIRESPTYDLYEVSREISTSFPFVSIILVVSEDKLDYKKAMRSGALDVMGLSTEESAILQTIEETEKIHRLKVGNVEKASPRLQYKKGHVITACSTKGGVGKTTLITNLATCFAKQKAKVVILDLNLQFGDVSMFFDIKPKKTIYEWVKEGDGHSSYDVHNFLNEHESGVYILSAPIRPEFSEEINEHHVESVITELQQRFEYVFIDTPSFLTETSLTGLEMSDDILLMTFMDLPTIKNTKLYIEILESLGLKEQIKVILNREAKVKGIQTEAVEKILGFPFFARIPNKEKIVLPSINEGKPLILTTPKTAIGKCMQSLTKKLSPETNETKGKTTKKVVIGQNV